MTNEELHLELKRLIWRAVPHHEQDKLLNELDKRFVFMREQLKEDEYRYGFKEWKADLEDSFNALKYVITFIIKGKVKAEKLLDEQVEKDKRSPKSWEL